MSCCFYVSVKLYLSIYCRRDHNEINSPSQICGCTYILSCSEATKKSWSVKGLSTTPAERYSVTNLLNCSGVNMEGAGTIWGLIAACSGSILYLFCSAAEGEGGEGASLCLSC